MPSLMQYLCNLNMLDLTQRTFTCSKLTMETAQLYTISVQSQQQRHQNHVTDVVWVSVVKFKWISYIFLVFPLVTLNKSVPAEPVVQRRSVEKVFLKFLQNSQENTCARASSTLSKKRLWHRGFPVNCAKFLRTPCLQNTSGGSFYTGSEKVIFAWV